MLQSGIFENSMISHFHKMAFLLVNILKSCLYASFVFIQMSYYEFTMEMRAAW